MLWKGRVVEAEAAEAKVVEMAEAEAVEVETETAQAQHEKKMMARAPGSEGAMQRDSRRGRKEKGERAHGHLPLGRSGGSAIK